MLRRNLFGTILAVGPRWPCHVAMYASPGGDLEEQVQHKLVTLPYYNVFDDLSFRVDNGTVILMGQVTQPFVRNDAENSVKHLEGVKAVKERN